MKTHFADFIPERAQHVLNCEKISGPTLQILSKPERHGPNGGEKSMIQIVALVVTPQIRKPINLHFFIAFIESWKVYKVISAHMNVTRYSFVF